jgi:hypothetical protein
MMDINVIELRSYLLKPGVREHFIDYFETHFIDTQEAVGMQILGQFRVRDEPDRFVWLRGFHDMRSRLAGLRRFYGGPVWAKYGPAANDMMLEWHNVRLLRPLSDIAELTNGVTSNSIANDVDAGTICHETGVVSIDYYETLPGQREAFFDYLQSTIAPDYQNESIQLRGYFVAEMAENGFPRLPVIQNANEFVVITACEHEDGCQRKSWIAASHDQEIQGMLISNAHEDMLIPTLRSPLR